jgi:hypothetical protein
VLQDCSSEEEALESLHENVASLIKLLEVEGNKSIENRGEDTYVIMLIKIKKIFTELWGRIACSVK